MQVDLVTIFLVFSIFAILFVINRLYYGMRVLRDRVNMLSNVIKNLKKTDDIQAEVNKKVREEMNKRILDEGF